MVAKLSTTINRFQLLPNLSNRKYENDMKIFR